MVNYSPPSILHLTIHHRHHRTHKRRHNCRCNDPCRVYTSILLPVSWCQVRTKKYFNFFQITTNCDYISKCWLKASRYSRFILSYGHAIKTVFPRILLFPICISIWDKTSIPIRILPVRS